jgi:TetR/AcrR family transcriptional regulator
MSPRTANPLTRDAILGAAAELFSRLEYHEVSMDDLASRAGVAKGTLYNHFGCKEDLFLALVRERSGRMLDQLEQLLSAGGSAAARVRSLTVHTFMFFVKYPAFFRLWEKGLGQAQSRRTEPLEAMRARLGGLIQMVICQGMTEGVIRPLSPETAADVLCGAVMGAVPRCLGDGVESPLTLRQREQLFDLVWEALRARSDINGHVDDRAVMTAGPPPGPGVTA